MSHRSLKRRDFLKRALGAGGAVACASVLPGRVLGLDGQVAPSNKIALGAIGIQHRGLEDLGVFFRRPDVQFIAICDIQKKQRLAIKAMADQNYGDSACAMYRDMNDMLVRDDLDAVLIATGDRWHSMASITAAKYGKDVY